VGVLEGLAVPGQPAAPLATSSNLLSLGAVAPATTAAAPAVVATPPAALEVTSGSLPLGGGATGTPGVPGGLGEAVLQAPAALEVTPGVSPGQGGATDLPAGLGEPILLGSHTGGAVGRRTRGRRRRLGPGSGVRLPRDHVRTPCTRRGRPPGSPDGPRRTVRPPDAVTARRAGGRTHPRRHRCCCIGPGDRARPRDRLTAGSLLPGTLTAASGSALGSPAPRRVARPFSSPLPRSDHP